MIRLTNQPKWDFSVVIAAPSKRVANGRSGGRRTKRRTSIVTEGVESDLLPRRRVAMARRRGRAASRGEGGGDNFCVMLDVDCELAAHRRLLVTNQQSRWRAEVKEGTPTKIKKSCPPILERIFKFKS